jgi:competence protein ComFB
LKEIIMAFADKYDFEHLKNESETMVLDELGRQLDTFTGTVCRCNDCVNDMAALALNMVRPLYRVSLLGTLYTAHAMEEEEFAESIQEAVARAIDKISKNPGHAGADEETAEES